MSTVPEQILGFYDLPQDQKNVWMARYGASAPYFWAAQTGNLEVPPEAQGFYGLPEGDQATWYGEYGVGAAQEWAHQAAQAPQAAPPTAGAPAAPSAGTPNPISRSPGGYGSRGFLPSGEPRPLNPLQGTTDFGRGPLVDILPAYAGPLKDKTLAPGYLEGSGTYNQFKLDQGGLFGSLPGQTGTVNLRWGLGGPGDPSNGSELQTPDRWFYGTGSTTPTQGDAKWRATGGTWKGGGGGGGGWAPVDGYAGVEVWRPAGGGGGGTGGGYFSASPAYDPNVIGNWNRAPQTQGYDVLITNFMRSDTPNGIGSGAWGLPDQYWGLLIDAIRKGIVQVNSPDAWAMLAQKNPAYTPQNIGGAALTGASGASASGAGVGTGATGTDNGLTNYYAQMAAVQQANQAMQQAYSEWTMATGDEKLAMEKAQQAWQNTFDQQKEQFTQGVTQAGLTGQYQGAPTVTEQQRQFQNAFNTGQLLGTYNGQDTLAKQQLQQGGALELLRQQSALQGPRDVFKYWQMAGSTPQGLQSALSSLAGNYQLAGSTYQGTPGPATLESRVGDLTSNAQGQAAGNPSSYALRSPNQWNLANWTAMSPSQQQGVLGLAEAQGYYGDDVLKQLAAAAPRYGGPSSGTVKL